MRTTPRRSKPSAPRRGASTGPAPRPSSCASSNCCATATRRPPRRSTTWAAATAPCSPSAGSAHPTGRSTTSASICRARWSARRDRPGPTSRAFASRTAHGSARRRLFDRQRHLQRLRVERAQRLGRIHPHHPARDDGLEQARRRRQFHGAAGRGRIGADASCTGRPPRRGSNSAKTSSARERP